MAEENAQSAASEGGKPQDPAVEAQPQDTKPEEGGKPQDSGGVEGNDRTPNVHKLERDVANRDKTIAELKANLAEKEKGEAISRRAWPLSRSRHPTPRPRRTPPRRTRSSPPPDVWTATSPGRCSVTSRGTWPS